MKRERDDEEDAGRDDEEPTADAPAAAAEPAPFAGAPAEAGELAHATIWYYEDQRGEQQGPYPSQDMRAWLDAGYLPAGSTRIAASYYGEVPEQMWPIAELWADPASEAFRSDAAAVELPPAPFVEASAHEGKKQGYIFRIGHYGLGYYIDDVPVPTVTFETLEAEKEERRRRVEELNKNQPNTKHSIHTY